MRFRYEATSLMHVLAVILTLVSARGISNETCTRNCGTRCIRVSYICTTVNRLHERGCPVILLHGLSGSKETWDGIRQNISRATHRTVCSYDARNHGDSKWCNEFTVDFLADDLGCFIKDMGFGKVSLLGHSLGGLTVMKYALRKPCEVEKLIVEDIRPGEIPPEFIAEVLPILKIVESSLSKIPDGANETSAKKAVHDYLIQFFDESQIQVLFDTYPLMYRCGKWEFKANVHAFVKAFENTKEFVGKLEGLYRGKALFIYGTESPFQVFAAKDYILELFPCAKFYAVEGANHQIHSLYPEFQTQVIKFLNSK